jgi:hypothetical protein
MGGIAMSKKLGEMIGKVRHSFKITNHQKQVVTVSVTYDFSTVSDADIRQWLASDRTIALQRPARSLSEDEIRDTYDGQVILANEVGKKMKSRQERIQELVNVGIPEKLAEVAIDDPAKFETIMAALNE